MKAVIEVGANIGTDTERLKEKYKDCLLITFEPVPELAEKLTKKYENDKNVIV